MTMIIAFAMAEICSAYPSAGSVYHWTGQLVPLQYAPLISYICGWTNFLGNCAGDASFANGWAQFLSLALTLSGNEAIGQREQVGTSIAILFIWSLLNCFRIDRVGWVNQVAAFVHMASILIIVVATLVLAPSNNTWSDFVSAAYNTTVSIAPYATGTEVFTAYYNGTGFTSKSFACAIGISAACFAFSGYEASGHIAEETRGATRAAPLGIISTCIATGIGGVALLLTLLFVIPTVDDYLFAGGVTGNAAVDALVISVGNDWAEAMTWLVVINLFFAGVSSVAITGRITFALSRDKGFPAYEFLTRVHPRFQSPINSIMFVFLIDALLMLLPLDTTADGGGSTAFYSIVGLTAIGFQVSYAIPILMKVIFQPVDFPVTDLSLGRWSIPFGIASVLWLLGTSCLFFLPTTGPTVDKSNMNWLIVVVAGFFVLGTLNWIFNSQFVFTGPARSDAPAHLSNTDQKQQQRERPRPSSSQKLGVAQVTSPTSAASDEKINYIVDAESLSPPGTAEAVGEAELVAGN
jgi:amino acid transporter